MHDADAEKLNALTHFVGLVLALAGSVVLILQAAHAGDARKIVGVSIYSATLVMVYCFSALYHSLAGNPKNILRKLDHHSIYLLIAGTYTPFCLVTLHGLVGSALLGVEWGLAVVGGLQDLRPRSDRRMLSVAIYVVMGWMALVAIVPLLQALGLTGFTWLLVGGLFYTVGIVFFALDARFIYAHTVWHLLVMAGSATHYVAILKYVL